MPARPLGERLFYRTSRCLALSQTGRVLSGRVSRILTDAEAMAADALAQAAVPRGRVPMASALPDFFAACHEISVDLHLGDRLVDLAGNGFDPALRIAALTD
ncbi:MAG: hypothetical protein J2P48_03255 [Alphaproteobacteria bacterium]|nr:hypothetical protein [Alphaproteobacteria bacterium]